MTKILYSKDWISTSGFLDSPYSFFSKQPVTTLHDAIIVRKWGTVCHSDFTLVSEVHDEHIHWQPALAGTNEVYLPRLENRELETKRRLEWLQVEAWKAKDNAVLDLRSNSSCHCYLMHCFEWYPYGHFFDTLQRLFNLKDERPIAATSMLISGSTNRVNSFMEHLAILGCNTDMIQVIPSGFSSVRLQNLIVPNSVAEPSQYTTESISWLRERYLTSNQYLQLANHLDSAYNFKGNKDLVLFLDRESTGSRYILNADEVCHEFESKGLSVVKLRGNEPFLFHLYMFSRAKYVFSPHGSMMVNTLFCPSDCIVFEAIPEDRLAYHFLRQCKPAQHVAFVVDNDEQHNIHFDTSLLKQFI